MTSTTTDEQLGAMARAIRQGVGMTLTAAARQAGTSRPTLSRIERGERALDPALRHRLASTYAAALPGGTR